MKKRFDRFRLIGRVDRVGTPSDDFKIYSIAFAFVCVALITPLAAAGGRNEVAAIHPNHFSTAEVGWNEKTGKFEIALCVWPSDLEKALAEIAGKSIDLEKKEGLDELMARYIASKFTIRKVEKDSATAHQTDVADSKGGPTNADRQTESDSAAASASSDKPADASLPASSNDKPADDSEAKEPSAEELQTDEGSSLKTKEPESEVTSSSNSGTKTSESDSKKSSATSAAENQPATEATGKQDVPIAIPDSKAGTEHESHDHISSAERKGEPEVVNELPEGFRWVGFESNAKDAWLYFELPADLEPATFEVENRVFFEFNEEQINQIRFTCAGRTRSFSLKRNVPTWQFSTDRSKLRKQSPVKPPSDGR